LFTCVPGNSSHHYITCRVMVAVKGRLQRLHEVVDALSFAPLDQITSTQQSLSKN